MTELGFYVPLDTRQFISGTLFPANLFSLYRRKMLVIQILSKHISDCATYVSEESAPEYVDEPKPRARQFNGSRRETVAVRYDRATVMGGRKQVSSVVERRQRVGSVRGDILRPSRRLSRRRQQRRRRQRRRGGVVNATVADSRVRRRQVICGINHGHFNSTDKKLCHRRQTARRAMPVEILSTQL